VELTYRLAHPVTPTAAAKALVLVTARAPEIPLKRRPLHLAIVLDRSGSMNGAPLATAKAALTKFVDQLVPQDRLTLVAFDDHVEVLAKAMPVSEKWQLHGTIAAIETGGMTNLSGGWLAAADAVLAAHADGLDSRIVVLTDGHANQGLLEPAAFAGVADGLRAKGVTTTTVGIGAEYDNTVLSAIAAHGGGNEHHVDGADEIGPILAAELDELLGLYAQNVTLRFAPAAGTSGHVLNGYPTQAEKGSSFAVFCGDMVSSDERSVLVEFDCGAGVGTQQLTAVTLSYQQVAGEVAFHEQVAFIDIAREDVLEPVAMDAIVSRHLAVATSVESRRKASELAMRGEIDEAQRILDDAANAAERAGLTEDATEIRRDISAMCAAPDLTAKRIQTRSSSRSRSRGN
jgi:Ca-activated chloride channel homolog